jgi:hypothetical protein
MDNTKYLEALRLVLDELQYPSRELRIAAICADCEQEMRYICSWLSKEVQKEIDLTTMFD